MMGTASLTRPPAKAFPAYAMPQAVMSRSCRIRSVSAFKRIPVDSTSGRSATESGSDSDLSRRQHLSLSASLLCDTENSHNPHDAAANRSMPGRVNNFLNPALSYWYRGTWNASLCSFPQSITSAGSGSFCPRPSDERAGAIPMCAQERQEHPQAVSPMRESLQPFVSPASKSTPSHSAVSQRSSSHHSAIAALPPVAVSPRHSKLCPSPHLPKAPRHPAAPHPPSGRPQHQ